MNEPGFEFIKGINTNVIHFHALREDRIVNSVHTPPQLPPTAIFSNRWNCLSKGHEAKPDPSFWKVKIMRIVEENIEFGPVVAFQAVNMIFLVDF